MPERSPDVLTRFHREVVLPDIERVVLGQVSVVERKVDQILSHLGLQAEI